MAFNSDYLSQVGPSGGNSHRLWLYKTEDTLATCDTVDYFAPNGRRERDFRIGDIINVCVVTNLDASNEALADQGFLIVNASSLTSVDTVDETTMQTATDTD